MSDFWQCPWDLDSVPAERAGQGEMSVLQHSASVTWLLLGLALKSSWVAISLGLGSVAALGLALKSLWLELGWPFLSSFAQMG